MQKKGTNLKTIPAFKPQSSTAAAQSDQEKSTSKAAGGSSTWSEGQQTASTGSGISNGGKEKQRKKPGRKAMNATSQISPKVRLFMSSHTNIVYISVNYWIGFNGFDFIVN